MRYKQDWKNRVAVMDSLTWSETHQFSSFITVFIRLTALGAY